MSTPLGQSPLGLVAASGNFDCVQILVDNGANVNVVNKIKNTTLHLAAMNGHHQVSFVIQNPIIVIIITNDGFNQSLMDLYES